MVTVDPSSVPRAERGLRVRDVVASVAALVLAGIVVVLGVTLAVPVVASPDTCPTCSLSGALVAVGGPVVVAIAVGFAGLAVTVLRIVDRRVSWPFALTTFLVCALAVGLAGHASAGLLAT